MKARVLPPEEWNKLNADQVPVLFQYVPDGELEFVVVEDDFGKVIAHMSVLRVVHFEGVWIDPNARNAGVTRALLKESASVARRWTDQWVFAAAADDRMRDVLDRLGTRVPIDTYVMSLGGLDAASVNSHRH